MNLEPVQFSDLSTANVRYFLINAPARVLVVRISGEAGNSHEQIGTFKFMDAMIAAGQQAWQPDGIILDFSELDYGWGDEMARTLGFASWCGIINGERPVGVVVSALNKKGLTSLVAEEMFADPKDWLFENIASAFESIRIRLSKLG